MDQALHQIFGIAFLVVCASHIAAPRAWFEFFVAMRRSGNAGIIIGMYTLPQGIVIAVLHSHWVWDWSLALTVVGWGMLVKGALYLLVPSWAVRSIPDREADAWKYAVGGAIGAVFFVPMLYCGFFQ